MATPGWTKIVCTTALPCSALEAAADRLDQTCVRVGDHEAHTGESAVGEAGEELAMPESTQSGGDHDRLGDDLTVFANMDVGRVQPDVHGRLMIQPACAGWGGQP